MYLRPYNRAFIEMKYFRHGGTKRQQLCRARNAIGYRLLREDRKPTLEEQKDLDEIARELGEVEEEHGE